MTTLAASSYGAVKAYVESLSLAADHGAFITLQVFKDAAPSDAIDAATGLLKKPYCTMQEGISVTPEDREDGGAALGGMTYVVELAQLDLWMNWRIPDGPNAGKALEDRTLKASLHRKLDGCLIDLSPTRVYRVGVQNAPRLVERDNNIVHVPFTLQIRRAL